MFHLTRLFFFCFLLLWSDMIIAQNKPEYAISLLDSSLIKNAEAVIRIEKTNLFIKSPREYVYDELKAVTIFDEDSYENAVVVSYNKYSDAEIVNVILYDESGHFLRKIKKSEIRDEAANIENTLLSDFRLISVTSLGGLLPYTIEYHWRKTYKETNYYPDWSPLSEKVSLENGSISIDAPENMVFHTRTLNGDFHYDEVKNGGSILRSWRLKNVKAIVREEAGPPDFELLPQLMISPSQFQVGDYTGSMTDWKSFGAFLYAINKDREKVTPSMASLVHQMTAKCTTSFGKIDTLYHWLQQNMRYVSIQLGIGGWQAFDAAYVEKNRYGDCKALSTFMKGMLQEVGIESFQVSIKADEEDTYFPDDFVSIDFNHMMLYIPGEDMWLECTSTHRPTGEIGRDEENKKVLLTTSDGGKISRTPTTPSDRNQITSTDTIFTTLPATIRGKETSYGNMQDDMRALYYYYSPEKQHKYFLEQFPVPILKLNHFEISTDRAGTSSSLTYDATLNKFGSTSGNRYFIPVNAIKPSEHSCTPGIGRKTDYISKDDYTETNDIYIAIPQDYTIEYLPPKSNFDFQGNHYLVELTVENQFIHVHHQVTESKIRLSPAEYNDLCSYYSSIAKSNCQMIVLKKSKA